MFINTSTHYLTPLQQQQTQVEGIDSMKTQLAVLGQRKLRLDDELIANEKEIASLQKIFAGLQKDLIKLNTLITGNSGVHLSYNTMSYYHLLSTYACIALFFTIP